MRPRHPTILPLFAWAAALSAVTAASRADKVAPPSSYAKPSPDGRYLFVMIPPGTAEDETRARNERKATEILARPQGLRAERPVQERRDRHPALDGELVRG